jgi:hypothetical protein
MDDIRAGQYLGSERLSSRASYPQTDLLIHINHPLIHRLMARLTIERGIYSGKGEGRL